MLFKKTRDFLIFAWFLATKIIGRDTDYYKPLVFIAIIKRMDLAPGPIGSLVLTSLPQNLQQQRKHLMLPNLRLRMPKRMMLRLW